MPRDDGHVHGHTSWTVHLSCKHTIMFRHAPPYKGESLWCVKCAKMRTVIEAPANYRIRCRGCPYGHSYGAMRVNAEIAAARHRKRHPAHKVGIYNGKELLRVLGEDVDEDDGPGLWPAHAMPKDAPF